MEAVAGHLPKTLAGLISLPWLQEAMQRHPGGVLISDCDECKENMNREARQSLGCGWEPVDPRIPVVPWTHQSGKMPTPVVCAGYAVRLPEVIEIARARFWKDSLWDLCDGEPHDVVIEGIERLESTVNEMQHWCMTPATKGGGQE